MIANKFLNENINSSILSAQYDLRGFVHALGFRMKGINPKLLSYVPVNLISFSVGCGKEDEDGIKIPPTINREILFYYHDENLTYEKVLYLCKKFALECNRIQEEAIAFLLKDILEKTDILKKETESKGEVNNYLRPLDKESNWGMIMLGLMEAFGVKEDEPYIPKTF